MKYGQQLHEQSVPQWAPYNVDYDELKNLIKVQTTADSGHAIAIPGQNGAVTEDFEESFFHEMTSQHDRVDLFVRSKADEINRRLQYLQKAVLRILSRKRPKGKPSSQKRLQRFAKYDSLISRCVEDTKALQHFVDAQRVAFQKILKKYRKWTGTHVLADRFHDEILGNTSSFLQRDFRSVLTESNALLETFRAATPTDTEPPSPTKESRRNSPQTRPKLTARATSYWNEYDDASDGGEGGEETFTIYVDPGDTSPTYPGAQTISYIMSSAKAPIEKVRAWLTPPSSTSSIERSALLRNGSTCGSYFGTRHDTTDTDIEDTVETSSVDYPSLFQHYPTFTDYRINAFQEKVLFRGMIITYVASILLLLVASILVATGKHKLRVEVDIGVVVGAIASLFFATLGIGSTLYRKEKLGWIQRGITSVIFVAICVLNGMLLIFVVGNSSL